MRNLFTSTLPLTFLVLCAPAAFAQHAGPVSAGGVVESQTVTLEGNTPAPALYPENDRGPIDDTCSSARRRAKRRCRS